MPAPRPAASVLLFRDAPSGLQVFVLRRVAQMAFAAGMIVFPGGSVDPTDGTAGDPVPVAAVRELLEECGVALLSTADGRVPRVPDQRREDLTAHRCTLVEVAEELGARIRTDWLVPVGRWITPVQSPRRYDTFFFAARLPDGTTAALTTTEADQGFWARPVDLLAQVAAGPAVLMPPTAALLTALAEHDTVAAALAAEWSLDPVLPTIVSGPGEPLRVQI